PAERTATRTPPDGSGSGTSSTSMPRSVLHTPRIGGLLRGMIRAPECTGASMTTTALSVENLESWKRDGYALVETFVDDDACAAMHERIVDLCRAAAAGEPIGDSIVDPERNPWPGARHPEDRV